MEFLTPEDALAALSFDGSSFFGSILKIRRPKDFVDIAVRIIILTISFLPYITFYCFMLLVSSLILSFCCMIYEI